MEADLAQRIVRGLRDDPEIMLAPVANESEAVTVAAGARGLRRAAH
ncbi:MAG: hypothetical protein ACREPG_01705 [Candidatus Binatia bacterium]